MTIKVKPTWLFAFLLAMLVLIVPLNPRLGSVENPVTVSPAVMIAVILGFVLLTTVMLSLVDIGSDFAEAGPKGNKKLPPISKRKWWGGLFNFSAGLYLTIFLLGFADSVPGGEIVMLLFVILLGAFVIQDEAEKPLIKFQFV